MNYLFAFCLFFSGVFQATYDEIATNGLPAQVKKCSNNCQCKKSGHCNCTGKEREHCTCEMRQGCSCVKPKPPEKKYHPYKLDTEYKGGFGGSDEYIELRCKVTKEGEYYHYSYKVKNASKKKKIMFSWQVTDIVAGGYIDKIPHWWNLKPQQEIEVKLKTKEPPVWYWGGLAKMMGKSRGDDPAWGEMFSGHGATMPPGTMYHVNSCGQPGPLPLSFLKTREQLWEEQQKAEKKK
jgi:hypothetical protein